MSHDLPDRNLDAQLRAVTPPPDLAERLRAIAGWSDAELDGELARVSVPQGLAERCRRIPADEKLDESLRKGTVPAGLTGRLKQIPRKASAGSWRRVAVAAVLLLSTGAGLYFAAARFGWPGSPGRPAGEIVENHTPGPPPLGETAEGATDLLQNPRPGPTADATAAGGGAEPEGGIDSSRPSPPVESSLARQLASLRLLEKVREIRLPLAAPPGEREVLPELESARSLQPQGLPPPLVRGFDRKYLAQNHVHPVVSPGADPRLAGCAVPLVTRTDSFDLLVRRSLEHRWPDPQEIRPEEFLSALDDPLSPPGPGEVAVRTAAGVSPFRENGARLLHLAAVTGANPGRPAQAEHLVLVIDVSQSMHRGGRMERVRRAVLHQIDRLSGSDRISLVLFGSRSTATAIGCTAAQRSELIRALAEVRPEGTANLLSGLQQAMSVALETPGSSLAVRRIALVTDGESPLPEETQQALCSVLSQAAGTGLVVHVIDVGDLRQGGAPLAEIARSGKGTYRLAASCSQMTAALTETWSMHSSSAATQAVLRVQFNPQAVAGYRLIGHEPGLAGGLEGTDLGATLRWEEAAGALFEIWLMPDGEERLGEIELRYQDSKGEPRIIRQGLSRLQVATTWRESPLSLQAAAIAAEAAEVLRGSPYVASRPRRDLKGVLETVRTANPRLQEQPWFERFVEVLSSVQAVKPRGG